LYEHIFSQRLAAGREFSKMTVQQRVSFPLEAEH
jgi:hypothetical protein